MLLGDKNLPPLPPTMATVVVVMVVAGTINTQPQNLAKIEFGSKEKRKKQQGIRSLTNCRV